MPLLLHDPCRPPRSDAPRTERLPAKLWTIVLVWLIPLLSCARAEMSVTSEPSTEGNDPTHPPVVRFTLTQSPAATTATTWEYATSSDTAREGRDYVGARGSVTLPAHATTAVVEVSVVPDDWKESDESFALIVWPQGGAPVPVLTEIPKPETPYAGEESFRWPSQRVTVSEGNWQVGALLGEAGPGTWQPQRMLPRTFQYVRESLLSGDHAYEIGPTTSAFGSTPEIIGAPKNRPGFPLWEPETRHVLPSSISQAMYVMAGDVLAVRQGLGVTFYRLFDAAPPRPVGFSPVPGSSWFQEYPSMAFDGRTLAMATGSALHVYEASEQNLNQWQLTASLPGQSDQGLALEGDTMIVRRVMPPGQYDRIEVRRREWGGPNAWGLEAVLALPSGSQGPGATVLRNGIAYVAEPDAEKIHVFIRDTTTGEWQRQTPLTAPTEVPGARFGKQFALGGRDLFVLGPGTYGKEEPNASWGGRLTGATARIIDDDLPHLTLPTLTALEPRSGTAHIEGIIELSHPAPTTVELILSSSNGSAQAGADYEPVNQRLTIEAGAQEVRFQVPVAADSLIETDEDFFLTASAVAGARLVEATVPWRIRDTTPKPVIFAENGVLFEDGKPGTVPVHLQAAQGTLAVPWSVLDVPHPGLPEPLTSPPMATVGQDLLPQTGTVAETSNPPATLSITALADAIDDPLENVAVAWHVDASVAAASFSPRLLPLPSAATIDWSESTTDGNWLVLATQATTGDPEGLEALLIYGRDASAPGGWTRVQTIDLQAAGVPAGTRGRLKLRQGRLVYHPFKMNQAWFFAAPENDPAGIWKSEASIPVPWIDGWTWDSWDFDGSSLVVQAVNSLTIFERGDGSWSTAYTIPLEDENISSYQTLCRIDGAVCAYYFTRPDDEHGVQILERTGPPSRPWVRRAFLPRVPRSFPSLVLQGNMLAVGNFGGVTPDSILYQRSDTGEWRFDQSLDDLIVLIDQGLLFGTNHVYARTDDATPPWMPFGTGLDSMLRPEAYPIDLCRNIMIAMVPYRESDGIDRQGLALFGPGVGLTVVENAGVPYTLEQVSAPFHELPESEGFIEVRIKAPFLLPSDVEIPFRTLSTGTAAPHLDYRPVDGAVVIRAGQRDAFFRVPVLPDRLVEGDETLHVALSPPTFGVVPAEPVVLTLKEPPLAFLPQQLPFTVVEPASGQQAVTIPIRLARPLAVDTTFEIDLIAVTAGPEDATLASRAVTLPAGHSVLPATLLVSADALQESTESLALRTHGHQVEVRIEDAAGAGAPDAYATTQATALNESPDRNVLANDFPNTGPVQPAHPPEGGTVEWRPDGTFRYSPHPNFIGVDTFSYRSGELGVLSLPAFTHWKWLHWTVTDFQGPASVIPGFNENWMSPAFDDSSWSDGAWRMGYGPLGDPPVPIDTPLSPPPPPKWYGAYFRTHFDAPNQPAPGLSLTLAYDDAVIIYLNGTELGRHGKEPLGTFATDPDRFDLLALNGTDGNEETQWHTLVFPGAQVRPGANTIAISLHNSHRRAVGEVDLGLSVADVTIGTPAKPVRVDMLVTDAGHPPVVVDDVIVVTGTTSPLDSRYWADGSLFANDRMLSASGTPYDPILEAETGGTPVGPVTFDAQTGHFQLGAPPAFFGTTSFTYRVRDKDGWSQPATVTLTVTPTRSFDRWRQDEFGGGSLNSLSSPEADGDADTLANLVEFALGTDPSSPDLPPVLSLDRRSGTWVAEFIALEGFGEDAFIDLESSTDLAAPAWSRLTRLNDTFPSLEVFAPGVTQSTESLPGNKTRYSFTLPPTTGSAGFLRLRVSQERHALDP